MFFERRLLADFHLVVFCDMNAICSRVAPRSQLDAAKSVRTGLPRGAAVLDVSRSSICQNISPTQIEHGAARVQ